MEGGRPPAVSTTPHAQVLAPRRRLTMTENDSPLRAEDTPGGTVGDVIMSRKTFNIAEAEEDPIEGFALSVVKDYLRRKGHEGSLSLFEDELIDMQTPAPSVRCWYDMAAATRLNAAIGRNHAEDRKEYLTMLEILVRELVETAERREPGSGTPGRALGLSPGMPARTSLPESEAGTGRERPRGGGGHGGRGGRIDPLAHITLPPAKKAYDAVNSSIPSLRPPKPFKAVHRSPPKNQRSRTVSELNKAHQKRMEGVFEESQAKQAVLRHSPMKSPQHAHGGGFRGGVGRGGGMMGGGHAGNGLVSSSELGEGEELSAAELAQVWTGESERSDEG